MDNDQAAERHVQAQAEERHVRGWSWLQIFFAAMVALLVARFSFKAYDILDIRGKYYPNMKFNSSTMYPNLYISTDERTMTNRPTHFTERVSSGPSHLHRYTGVLMNKPLSIYQKMYFEVLISYRTIGGKGILFEIGFEEREEIDKLLFLRDNWGTVYVRVTTDSTGKEVTLTAHDGKTTHQSYRLSKTSDDSWYDLRLGFHINPDDDVIKVFYSLDNNKRPDNLVYKFLNADINDNKWPVFAIYNPHMFQVHMKLRNAKDLIFDSSTIHPMIYISDNDLELSNTPMKTTNRRSYRVGQFQKYEGVMGNISFSLDGAKRQNWPNPIHYDVRVEYNVTGYINENYLFEIGLSRFRYIDRYWSVGSHRYSVSVYGTGCYKLQQICLVALREGIKSIVASLSSSSVGIYFKGTVHFSIDFEHKSVTVFPDTHGKHEFTDVDLTEPLWPVFALYKHSVDTLMTLNP